MRIYKLTCKLIKLAGFYVYKLSILIGIYVFWYGIDHLIEKVRFRDNILKLSSTTFFIYCSHEPILNLIRDSLDRFASNSMVFKLTTYCIIPELIIGISIVVSKFILRYFPTIYKVVTGGRK